MRRVFTLLVLISSACRQQTGSGLVPRVAPACYEGLAHGFVDTVQAPDAYRSGKRAWLILKPADQTPPMEGGGEVVIEGNPIRYGAGWEHVGDSIHIRQATFPSSEWMLGLSPEGLRGRLHSESDNMLMDSKNRVIKERTHWPAVLIKVECALLPSQPSNTR